MTKEHAVQTDTLPDPLVLGAEDIAFELFGNRDHATVRRTYYLLEQGHVAGAFKMGNRHAARQSALRSLGQP